MVFAVALQYPNGRTAEVLLDRAETPRPGTVFEMYGRKWRVTGVIDSDRRRHVDPADESTRYACVCVR
jgi:hypothetical protein